MSNSGGGPIFSDRVVSLSVGVPLKLRDRQYHFNSISCPLEVIFTKYKNLKGDLYT